MLQRVPTIALSPHPAHRLLDPRSKIRAAIKESIRERGMLNPIVAWKRGLDDFVIIDGLLRFEVCRELGYIEIVCWIVEKDCFLKLDVLEFQNLGAGL